MIGLHFADETGPQRGEVNCPEITLKGKDHQTPKLRQWVVHFSQVFQTVFMGLLSWGVTELKGMREKVLKGTDLSCSWNGNR